MSIELFPDWSKESFEEKGSSFRVDVHMYSMAYAVFIASSVDIKEVKMNTTVTSYFRKLSSRYITKSNINSIEP
uniref:Putative ovule protein n=1 Tax=Solanum chacoense TaxID=4108 RepID=A0A0V0H5F9_SOLCH